MGWWHATANVDDSVGIGGHIHHAMDAAITQEVTGKVDTKVTAERQKGRDEYDRDYALLERLPWSGQFLMKVVRRLFGRGEMDAVARLLDEFMGKVLTVYGEGRLAREKLERFINGVTEPLVTEVRPRLSAAQVSASSRLSLTVSQVFAMNNQVSQTTAEEGWRLLSAITSVQEMVVDLWAEVWLYEPSLAGPTFGPERVTLREIFAKWRRARKRPQRSRKGSE